MAVATAAARAQAPETLYTAEDIVRITAESPSPGMQSNAFNAAGQISARDWLSMKGGFAPDVSGANVSVLWARELHEDSDLELAFDYGRTRNDSVDLETYDLSLGNRLHGAKRSQIEWGLGLDEAMTTGFVRNRISLAQNKILVSLGTEMESSETVALGVRPSGRLDWKPTGLQSMWASISPTAYEVGYRVRPQRAVSVSMMTFYSDVGRTTNFEPLTAGVETLEEAYGTAVTADFQASSFWKLTASQTEVTFAAHESPIPKRMLMLRSSLELPLNAQVDATYRRASRIESGDMPAAGYTELDVRLAWHPRSALELSLSGRNLLNDPGARIAPFVAGLEGAPTPGRTAEANFAWSF
jgi:hypothetical protein